MLSIPNLIIQTQIYESSNSIIYKALKQQGHQPIILKVLKKDFPTQQEIARYHTEYQIIKSLDLPGVIKVYDLQKYENTLVLFLEDFGGDSLKNWLTKRLFKLEEIIQIAIKVTETLGEIHAANIIHKDINPSNIIFNPSTEEIKIIDFGISTQLNQENTNLKNPDSLQGSLAYISPEQTGRMNRTLDYRTDFYSLGITLYELLTNQLPFTSNDGLELVHSHIAKQPPSPSLLNPQIPQVLSDIVMKLIAKTAEERYQTAYGLKADLAECYQQLQRRGIINNFQLGTHDICKKLQIPQKLYGREQEIKTLISAFERVSLEKSELMLILGYSGIGKSSLVQELYKPITEKRGYFIRGKFDQYQSDIPYIAVVNAFQELIRQLLTENAESLNNWKEKILSALGLNAQVIIDVIPEVELIIGKQPPVVNISLNESQNRFNLTFKNFIQVFTQPQHPLVLFLDDLQWADAASLKLMKLLMSSDSPGLFLIGAYRDNEVSTNHPLMLTVNEISQTGRIINKIFLSPLDLSTVNQILIDTLTPAKNIKPLADLVWLKTGGSPFFLNEFIKSLYAEELLEFSYENLQWEWELEKIKARNFTDNVVEMMAFNIQKLPENTQNLLKLSACIGNIFELEILAQIEDSNLTEIHNHLLPAVAENLIIPLENIEDTLAIKKLYKNVPDFSPVLNLIYQFAHDRIQQAAYSLIPEKDKQTLHQKIGKIILRKTHADQQDEKIFDIVNHLNFGIDLITEESDKYELAKLNLIAGKKAKMSTAYQSALIYLNKGWKLLSENSWLHQYQLTLNLSIELAETNYLSGSFNDMFNFINLALENSQSIIDKVKVYEIKISALAAQNKLNEAIATGLEILELLGMKLSKYNNSSNFLLIVAKTELMLRNKSWAYFLNLPEMTNPEKRAIISIFSNLALIIYLVNTRLFKVLTYKSIGVLLKFGNSDFAPIIYSIYGLILCSNFDIDKGYNFGKIALTIAERYNNLSAISSTFLFVYLFIIHWKEHLKNTLSPLKKGHELALSSGNIEIAATCIQAYYAHAYFVGEELTSLVQEMAIYHQKIVQLNQLPILDSHEIYQQAVLNLLGNPQNPCLLKGEIFNEDVRLPLLQEINHKVAIFELYLHKLILGYLFSDLIQAQDAIEILITQLDSVKGLLYPPVLYFYKSLAELAIADKSPNVKNKILKQVKNNQKFLKKWAHYAPMNYLHKYYLVLAETYRIKRKYKLAIDYYDQAIAMARKNGYIHEEAIANELTAKFYLCQNKELIAKAYMKKARYCYQLWGANTKVQDLERRYPQLLTPNHEKTQDSKTTNSIITTDSISNLDIATVMKATAAIYGEILLDKLLCSLMKIIIENAGAQRGCLILPNQGRLLIEAAGTIDHQDVTVLQSIDIFKSQLVSEAIVNYVARTQETVVLADARNNVQFRNDDYIKSVHPKSVICVPLINQTKLISIVYLENNLTIDAFTPERVKILKLISYQAAISIENAKLYAEVRNNESRLVQLNQAYERFVPNQFLDFLKKSSIIDVKLGDNVQLEMSVLFSDIRSFTTLSETMTPEDNFKFINSYLSEMEPIITKNSGFIDKYIGDAIMALFSGEADNAVRAGIAMLRHLSLYNERRIIDGFTPIQIGIGIHTGSLMLGIIGGQNRLDGTVISDAVNLASRIEGLTKEYKVPLLITEQTLVKLQYPDEYYLRMLDIIKVRGKSQDVVIYEVFDTDNDDIREGKLATKILFEKAVKLYHERKFINAAEIFDECLKLVPHDFVARTYFNLCEEKYSRFKVDILKSTIALLQSKSTEFCESFYNILFTDSPELKVMFANTDMNTQQEKLWQSLELMVENLRQPKFTDLLLKGLGASHLKYGVLPEHYPLVGSALIKAMKINLGENWSSEIEAAWLDAYQVIQTLMISGTE